MSKHFTLITCIIFSLQLGNSLTKIRSFLANPNSGGIRKYVFWCCACGGLATILGALFLAVYFLLRSYTSTLGYFETIPTFVPATMVIFKLFTLLLCLLTSCYFS